MGLGPPPRPWPRHRSPAASIRTEPTVGHLLAPAAARCGHPSGPGGPSTALCWSRRGGAQKRRMGGEVGASLSAQDGRTFSCGRQASQGPAQAARFQVSPWLPTREVRVGGACGERGSLRVGSPEWKRGPTGQASGRVADAWGRGLGFGWGGYIPWLHLHSTIILDSESTLDNYTEFQSPNFLLKLPECGKTRTLNADT